MTIQNVQNNEIQNVQNNEIISEIISEIKSKDIDSSSIVIDSSSIVKNKNRIRSFLNDKISIIKGKRNGKNNNYHKTPYLISFPTDKRKSNQNYIR